MRFSTQSSASAREGQLPAHQPDVPLILHVQGPLTLHTEAPIALICTPSTPVVTATTGMECPAG